MADPFESSNNLEDTEGLGDVIKIGGYLFKSYGLRNPYKKFNKSQDVLIYEILTNLKKGKNIFVESPTGSGKTFSLLFSSILYQRYLLNELGNQSPPLELTAYDNKDFDKKPIIYYSSRTHEQLKQVADEIKNMISVGNKLRAVVLASKERYCLVKMSSNLSSDYAKLTASELCTKKFRSECDYYITGSALSPAIDGMYDIEDMINLCRETNACPYYLAKRITKVDIKLTPYNYLLSQSILHDSDSGKGIVIFDEGHNLHDACCEVCSFKISKLTIQQFVDGIKGPFYRYVDYTLLSVLGSFYDTVLSLFSGSTGLIEITRIVNNKHALSIPSEYKMLDVGENHWLIKAAEYAIDLSEYFYYVCNYQSIYKLYLNNDDTEPYIDIICLSPDIPLERILKSSSNVIVASGTLFCCTSLRDSIIKGSKDQELFQYAVKHYIGKEKVLSLLISSLDNVPFKLSYAHFKNSKDQIFASFYGLLHTIFPVVKGGIIVFFKNKSSTYDFYNFCTNEKKENLTLFLDSDFKKYKDSVKRESRSILLAYFRGNSSEGLNFSDELCRCVILFGLPYPNISDKRVEYRKLYSREWFDNSAINAAFQAAGRAIRHENDYGSILFVGQEYCSGKFQFPVWMNIDLNKKDHQTQHIYNLLKAFYLHNEQSVNDGILRILCCNCYQKVFEVKSSDIIRSFAKSESYYFISREHLTLEPNSLNEEVVPYDTNDQMGYSIYTCSYCETKICKYVNISHEDKIFLIQKFILMIDNLECSYDNCVKPLKEHLK